MLRQSNEQALSKNRTRFLIALVVFCLLYVSVSLFFKRKTNVPPISLTHQDSMQIRSQTDSIVKIVFPDSVREYNDSLYKAYRLDELDSPMNAPTSPLVDSLLREME